MKKTMQVLTLGALLTTLGAPAIVRQAVAQTNTTTAAGAGQTGQTDDDAKRALYKRFIDNYKTDRPTAYAAAKEYLSKYPNDTDAQANYLKKWTTAYDADQKETRKAQVDQLIKQQKYADAFAQSKQFLAEDQNDLRMLSNAAWSGWLLSFSGKNENNAEASNYARRAIELISAGKSPVEGKALTQKERDDTLGWLNYALGSFAFQAQQPDAAAYFIKAASYEGFAKKDPQLYERLALAYQADEYNKLAKDYAANFATEEKRNTPEGKAATAKINDVVDRIIDAYARAVAYSGTNAKYAAKKADWTKQLTDYYKFRHDNKTDGLDAYIAGVTSKPLPVPGQTAPAAATAPASTSSNTAKPAANTNTAKPNGNQTASTSTATPQP